MASNPSEGSGHGLEMDPNGPLLGTLTENKREGDGISVSGSNVIGDSQKEEPGDQNQGRDGDCEQEEKRDSVVDCQRVVKDDFFAALGTNGNKGTDRDSVSVVCGEGDLNAQVGEQKLLENDRCARYRFVLQEEKAGFSVGDLVWGKVKSHPWWPGQIFDPKYASEMALKRQKKDAFLVAYFGDKTFAWVAESKLKPFQTHFLELEKQISMEPFVSAVDAALEEVSRRVELAMACRCLTDETCANLKYKKVENAGIREGTCSCAVDRLVFVNAFQPESLLDYVLVLAQCPLGGFDRLDLVIAKAHMKAFYRSKGYPEIPAFVFAGGLVDNDAGIILAKSGLSEEVKADSSTPVASSVKSGKRSRGRPPKNLMLVDDNEQEGPSRQKEEKEIHPASSTPVAAAIKTGRRLRGRFHKTYNSEDSGEQMEGADSDYSPRASGKRRKVIDSEAADIRRSRKGREGADSDYSPRASGKRRKVIDSEAADIRRTRKGRVKKGADSGTEASLSTRARSLRVGDRISRVANQLKEASTVGRKDANLSSKPAEKNEAAAQDYPSPSEMLEELHTVATDLMNDYSFPPMILNFFIKFRDNLSPVTYEKLHPEKSMGRKRGRKNKVGHIDADYSEMSELEPEKSMGRTRGRKKKAEYTDPDYSETSEPDYMQDSYWSDIVLQSSPEREPTSRGRKRKSSYKEKGQMKKMKHAGESLPAARMDCPSNEKQEEMEAEITGNAQEKMKVEKPTALILSFNGSGALPSTSELNKFFSPYGPLREEETEVLRKTNRAKVVFRYRYDAEKAYSSAGKYSVFGAGLVSYQLKYSPSPKSSPAASPQDEKDASTTKDEFEAKEGTEAEIDKT